jgi:hypothetical protein
MIWDTGVRATERTPARIEIGNWQSAIGNIDNWAIGNLDCPLARLPDQIARLPDSPMHVPLRSHDRAFARCKRFRDRPIARSPDHPMHRTIDTVSVQRYV